MQRAKLLSELAYMLNVIYKEFNLPKSLVKCFSGVESKNLMCPCLKLKNKASLPLFEISKNISQKSIPAAKWLWGGFFCVVGGFFLLVCFCVVFCLFVCFAFVFVFYFWKDTHLFIIFVLKILLAVKMPYDSSFYLLNHEVNLWCNEY